MKKLIAGNWKMNGSQERAGDLLRLIAKGLEADRSVLARCDVAVFPPSLYVAQAVKDVGEYVLVGAQDCSVYGSGAYTGEISAPMIADCGAKYVLVGHSERRQYHGETDEIVAQKAKAAHKAGLVAVICIGETEQERQIGAEQEVVGRQIEQGIPEGTTAQNTVIAYEPVWAIGTGKTATPEDVALMHSFIREKLGERLEDSQEMRILYGGSMKPDNAAQLLATPHVDGGLIGGASLEAESFLAIAKAAP